jgi:2,5-furandicarboxylate decarboxylase 1
MSKIADLRSYLQQLESAGQLARIRKPVSMVHQLADIAATLDRADAGAGFFENVIDSPWPIVAGAVGGRRRAAVALDCDEDEIVDRMAYVLEEPNVASPTPVAEAAWHANAVTGDEVDLAILPIPTHSRGDGGAFVTGAVTVTKDPISGRGNLSYNRMLRMGPRTFGFNVNEWRDVGTFMKNRKDPDAPFPVAFAIGLDPAITIAAGVRTPLDELLIAGAIRGEGVPVCKGLTVDIDIPAAAEVVIEGHILPAQRAMEGPLAEFHGYHGETIIPGWYEHIYIGNVLPREPLLRRFVRHLDPAADVHIPPSSNGFLAVIQIDRDNPGQPKNLAMAAMTAHINIRNVVVVDRDIDMFDPAEVLWAITNRADWRYDTFVVRNAQGHEMDPVADQRGVSFKLGIDATYKRERREYGERVRYQSVNLSEWLS